jgi:hypothetical protein
LTREPREGKATTRTSSENKSYLNKATLAVPAGLANLLLLSFFSNDYAMVLDVLLSIVAFAFSALNFYHYLRVRVYPAEDNNLE